MDVFKINIDAWDGCYSEQLLIINKEHKLLPYRTLFWSQFHEIFNNLVVSDPSFHFLAHGKSFSVLLKKQNFQETFFLLKDFQTNKQNFQETFFLLKDFLRYHESCEEFDEKYLHVERMDMQFF